MTLERIRNGTGCVRTFACGLRAKDSDHIIVKTAILETPALDLMCQVRTARKA